MKYLWADTTIDNDYYFYVADKSLGRRSFGSHELRYSIRYYKNTGINIHFNINEEDRQLLPVEFLE